MPNQAPLPERPAGGEQLPNVAPEEAGTAAPAEAGKQVPQNQPAAPPPVASDPAVPASSGARIPTVAGPAIADDVDVIEKDWVDKANEVVAATKNDPHREEEAVEDLQIDYLKKRYGKEVGKSEEEPSPPAAS